MSAIHGLSHIHYPTLGISLPAPKYIPTPDMYALEAELQQKFSAKCINGEWFDLSPEDVEYIKGVANG